MHRRDSLRSEKILQDKLFEKAKNSNVRILWNHQVEEIIGDDAGVTGVRLVSTTNGEKQTLDVSGVFIIIGHKPNTEIFKDQLKMTNGYIDIETGRKGNATQTSIEGVFAAGM